MVSTDYTLLAVATRRATPRAGPATRSTRMRDTPTTPSTTASARTAGWTASCCASTWRPSRSARAASTVRTRDSNCAACALRVLTVPCCVRRHRLRRLLLPRAASHGARARLLQPDRGDAQRRGARRRGREHMLRRRLHHHWRVLLRADQARLRVRVTGALPF